MDLASFFSNDTPTTKIYTLSLHDALPIFAEALSGAQIACTLIPETEDPAALESAGVRSADLVVLADDDLGKNRSEEHTSELQSHHDLVCRLLLEKKKYYSNSPRLSIVIL